MSRLLVLANKLSDAADEIKKERDHCHKALFDALWMLWRAHAKIVDLIEAEADSYSDGKHDGSAYFCTCSMAKDYHRLLKVWQGESDQWHPTMPGE